ncbi:transposase [Streptomyces sp. Edi2]|uniref:transposase n=1 Tax=Streptomyces sp. Edi2 TaxID=3162528 RepID=UPI003305B954
MSIVGDLRTFAKGCSSSRAWGADGTEPDRPRKKGAKTHLIVDRRGLPLSIGISAANLHDNQALIRPIRAL